MHQHQLVARALVQQRAASFHREASGSHRLRRRATELDRAADEPR